MIRVYKYPFMGIANLASNDWEVLLVLSMRGYATGNPSYWIRLDHLDSILTGSTLKVNSSFNISLFTEAQHVRDFGPQVLC